ncbi:type III pantothenate kinase [Flammeovirga pectinis]|uniref:Type III pantothenate kinase n=1 Tax=Flammeovirga pectinis TaxID=2494373 RepID=A0A3S9P4X1_9BACT|nr:type III pantothenate kinase [Flammeovirga pectinis]AZQ63241.1 type III pantothenate kinase [Flammeovirga pectinis]
MQKRVSIDIGNTLMKVGFFKGNELIDVSVFQDNVKLFEALEDFSCESIGIANVGRIKNDLIQHLEKEYKVVKITTALELPFINSYATPQSLGVDRIAAVIGAKSIFPNDNCLVIDIGTCVTYDFITKENEYLGGGISPGLDMRFKAMHHFTANLPLITFENIEQELVGNSTENCLKSGAINGLIAEINGIIALYVAKYGNITTLLCGGVANTFESKLNSSIFADRNLVLKGIDRILRLNV